MLARLDGRGQHARMLEGRRGDDHRVHVARGQQFLVILVDRRLFDLDLLRGRFDAVVEQIAQRGDARPGIRIEDGGIILAAAADPIRPTVILEFACDPRTVCGATMVNAVAAAAPPLNKSLREIGFKVGDLQTALYRPAPLWRTHSCAMQHALCGAGFQPAADFNRPADQCAGADQAG